MLTVINTLILTIIGTALATTVALRTWERGAARLFVAVVALLIISSNINWLQASTHDAASGYRLGALAVMVVGLLQFFTLLLFSALFAPRWWDGARPGVWIMAPYALALLALGADLAMRGDVFVQGMRPVEDSYRLQLSRPGGVVLLGLFSVGWLVHLGVLATAFIKDARQRPVIGMLAGAIVAAMLVGLALERLPAPVNMTEFVQALPLMGALAYAVLRTQLLAPTRLAFEQTMRAMGDAVVVLDSERRVVYANPAAARLGILPGRTFAEAVRAIGLRDEAVAALLRADGGAQALTLAGRRIEASCSPVVDERGRPLGWLVLGRDITEAEQQRAQIEQERAQLSDAVRQLETEQRERAQLSETVRQLSIPVIPVLDGVLVLPLVGDLDTARAEEFSTVLFQGIERERARLVLLDITGVPLLDTGGARLLMRGVQGAALLGARCVLVGVRPEIAQSLVALGMDLSSLQTAATLREALAVELRTGR
jgi:anti-anti-sigma factor